MTSSPTNDGSGRFWDGRLIVCCAANDSTEAIEFPLSQTILRRSRQSLVGGEVTNHWTDLIRLELKNEPLIERDVCSVHNIRMRPKELPTSAESRIIGVPIYEVAEQFPNFDPQPFQWREMPRSSYLAFVCAQCDKALEEWRFQERARPWVNTPKLSPRQEAITIPRFNALKARGTIALPEQPPFDGKITVFVQGEVHHPGEIQVPKGTTILQAINAAGGFTDFAAPPKIYLKYLTRLFQAKLCQKTKDGKARYWYSFDDKADTDFILKSKMQIHVPGYL